jgi:hypothetical protein
MLIATGTKGPHGTISKHTRHIVYCSLSLPPSPVYATQYDKLLVNYHCSPLISKTIYQTKQERKMTPKFIKVARRDDSNLKGAMVTIE